ncbi:family 10 glycosylhydrolase [Candidatus Sumerlaeota bacterium]|nr:family 10 glycosylhydrolase [Candidatus Sumerlaeota bacterium]
MRSVGHRSLGGNLGLPLILTLPLLHCSAPKWEEPSALDPPELRGAWIATVNNIDWPSEPGLPAAQQREELCELLDAAADVNLNMVILQVRTAGDALYDSPLEPWSEYLTGEMGEAPDPHYDPLEFAIEEAHARGLELHAWFNPYRARYHTTVSDLAPNHILATRPDLVRRYGRHFWCDPGEPEVMDHTVGVILDVVRRYDIDGVHFDDYFYPYPETDAEGNEIAFDDDASWRRYREGGGTLERDDWRRDNVNRLVERLSHEIRAIDPDCRFGISPFGIWRPGHPPGIEGFDQWAQMWADPKHWAEQGWLDYLAPQLYWPTYQAPQSYSALLRWWLDQELGDTLLVPGNATYRVADEDHNWGVEEYDLQMRLTREMGAPGNIHYHLGNIRDNWGGVRDLLRTRYYHRPAPLPWAVRE